MVNEDFGVSKLAERFGVARYPAVFVDDVLVAKPKDFGFFGERGSQGAGRYTPWLDGTGHALFQEVAYDSLLRRDRMDHHRRIARSLRDDHPELLASEPEAMARHCEGAGWTDEAAAYYLRAGERAGSRSALVEAVAHLHRALELTESLEPSMERDRLELSIQMALGAPLQAGRGSGSLGSGRGSKGRGRGRGSRGRGSGGDGDGGGGGSGSRAAVERGRQRR